MKTSSVRPAAAYWAAALVVASALFVAANSPSGKSSPSGSMTLPGMVESVHDGDTATVEVTFRMSVRLLDCWAPELSDHGGQEARDALAKFATGKRCQLVVPLGTVLGDSFSFGRVLGRVSIDGEDASDWMVRQGHATRRKGE